MKCRTTTSNIVLVALVIAVGFISLGLISYAAAAQTTNENNVTIPAGASMISGTGLNDPNNGKAFDSGLTSLIPGKSWSHQFIIAGTFPYFCELHPAMTGLVVVS